MLPAVTRQRMPGPAIIESAQLAPIARTTVTDEVVKRLIGLIIGESLRPGDRLPSERVLTARLGVGRGSLREAIRTLGAIGAIDVVMGDGMFVGRGETSLLAKPLQWGLLMSESSAREVMDARCLVESDLAGLAAARATDEEIDAIGRCLALMRSTPVDAVTFSSRDLDFHLAVARAAHNGLLFHVLSTLQQIVRVWIVETFRSDDAGFQEIIARHVAVYEAIRARNVQRAREAMTEHLTTAGARLLATLAHRPERPVDVVDRQAGFDPRAAGLVVHDEQ
ncbi:MAG: FadR family transcriptional regulator [Chloroflexi bacterium]|nr:FadR family transcriptional regulator [Chloroflexota bacterium]